jgi:dethiobiotin synthase
MIFVTATDTNIGKTISCAWLCVQLNYFYWKPVQCGDLDTRGDSGFIQNIVGKEKIIPSTYEFKESLSPHEAAKRENINIAMNNFNLPNKKNLIIEGAGGVYVPLNNQDYIIDLIKHIKVPVILVCKGTLGTINHTVLSVKALQTNKIPIIGLIISGESHIHNEQALEYYTKLSILVKIPILTTFNKKIFSSIPPIIPFNEWNYL